VTSLLSTQPHSALTGASALTRPDTGPRTRTPSAIKWLLVERAALAGAQQTAIAAIPRLKQQVEIARASLALAEHELSVAERALEISAHNLQALDSTLAQVNSCVDPRAGGIVKAWKGRYGERGALTEYLLELLSKSAPAPMALADIVDQVELHFGIHHAVPESRKKLRYSIRTCLRQLHAKTTTVQPYRPTQTHPAGHWVYRQTTSISELQKLAATLESKGDHAPNSPDQNSGH